MSDSERRERLWQLAVEWSSHVLKVMKEAPRVPGTPPDHVERLREKYLAAKKKELFGETS